MSDQTKPPRVDPITRANQTSIGEKLGAIRKEVGGFHLSRKELARLAKAKDGVSMMNQAPRTTSDTVAPLEHMIRMVPTTRRHSPFQLNVGDRAPSFSMTGSDGSTVSLDLARPIAIRLTRAVGTGVICPACVPGLDELIRTHDEFEAAGAELVVVFPVSHELTKEIVRNLALPYPIYSDEDWNLFKAYETGFSAGAPLPAWIVIDRDGVIQFLWRAADGGLFDKYPESAEILAELRRIDA
jgi:peroxiredoxin